MKKYLLIPLVLFSLLSIVHARGTAAVDLDIHGAKLWMTPEQVKNAVNRKYNRNFGTLSETKVDGVIISYNLGSYAENDRIRYEFDENKRLYHIERHVRYGTDVPPNWKLIDTEIIKKYGKPDIQGQYTRKVGELRELVENKFSSCWGECYLQKQSSGGSFADKKDKGISLSIEHGLGGIRNNKTGKTEYHHTLSFSLVNNNIFNRIFNIKYRKRLKKKNAIDL